MQRDSNDKALNQKVQKHSDGSKEYWRDVPDYRGTYRVSDWGRLKSLDRFVPHSRLGRQFVKGKILNISWNGHYFHVILCKDNKETLFLIHRLALEAFCGDCPENMEACHNDGNAKNNKLENLRWDTRASNIEDKIKHGTNKGQGKGEKHSLAKLTEDQAREIKRRANAGERPCHLCKEFDVNECTIRDIRDGKSWSHI